MIVANEKDKNSMFKKNLELLSPWLRESVLQINESELWEKIIITYNDEGFPICTYVDGNKKIQITSENPTKEASQWCDNIILPGAGAMFMYGCGFGYSLFQVFSKKQPHTLVILFEQDIYIFTAMLYYFDLEPIIKTEKIVFLIGDIENFSKAFDHIFFSIVFANCTNPTVLFTIVAQRNFKPIYLEIHNYVFSQLGLFVFYIGNDHLDNLIGLNNLLSNIKEIILNPFISSLKDKFKKVPAFIVANGPSLDKNIHELSNIQDKGLIICTESAIIPLMKNNIKPDILTIIERTKYTYKYHFENNQYPDDISLLCLGLVDKQVYPSFPGEKIPIFRNKEAINQWINNFIGDGSALEAGANVSHLAFELAVYLGADPIIFVGQDYAYGPEGLTHSRDSAYMEEKGKRARDILNSKPIVYVESIEGTMIPSNQLWIDFKTGLERKLGSHPYKIIIDATEGGARIKGTVCKDVSKVIEEYCTESIQYRVNELIKENKTKINIRERLQQFTNFINNVKEYIVLFRNQSKIASKRKLTCQQMIRLSKGKDYNNHRNDLEKAYLEHMNIFQSFIADDLSRAFSQQIIFVFFYLMNRVGLIDSQEKIMEIFEIQYGFFKYLNLVYQSVSIHLEDAVYTLEKVVSELNDIVVNEVK